MIGHLILTGGTVREPGNVTAAAEFNMYCDSEAAKQVFASPVTKTLVPLDITSQVVMGFDFLERMRARDSSTGRLLQRILPGAYRSVRQHQGIEGIYIHDAVSVVLAMQPSLFHTKRLYGDVETAGQLTHGATVFDLRPNTSEQPNMDVVTKLDVEAVQAAVIHSLESA
jgi:inosine-uridine nucleoside N-ribohydrolase